MQRNRGGRASGKVLLSDANSVSGPFPSGSRIKRRKQSSAIWESRGPLLLGQPLGPFLQTVVKAEGEL